MFEILFQFTRKTSQIVFIFLALHSFEPSSNLLTRLRFATSWRVSNSKPIEKKYGIEEFLFFTNISMLYTAFCMLTGLLSTLPETCAFLSSFRGLYVFLTLLSKACMHLHLIALPTATILEVFVTLIFWILFLRNPKLVKDDNPRYKSIFELIRNEFVKHVLPLLILLLEYRKADATKSTAHKAFFAVFTSLYFLASEHFKYTKKKALYGFLDKMTIQQRATLFLGLFIMSILLYELVFVSRQSQNSLTVSNSWKLK